MTEHPIRLCSMAIVPANVAVLEALARIAGDRVDHVLTLGQADIDCLARDFTAMRPAQGQSGTQFSGAAQALDTGPGLASAQVQAIDILTGGPDRNAFDHHGVQDPQDYQHITHIAHDVLGQMLHQHRITHVLSFAGPASFYETCLLQAARAMGVEVLILKPGAVPERLVSMRDENDLGHLGARAPDADATPVALADGRAATAEDQSLADAPDTARWPRLRDIGGMIAYLLVRDPLRLLNPAAMARIMRQMRRLPGHTPWRDPYYRFFHTDPLAYCDHLTGATAPPPDLDRPFVYFQMPHQPMTTGGRYRDPLLALERLAEMLPEGHMIHVEDQQGRNRQGRSPLSFHRLNRIRQARLLPGDADRQAVLAGALAVVDLAGTLGWQALCLGKPVLCFEATWWAEAPGVTRYRPGLSLEDILANRPERGRLERFAGVIEARSHSLTTGTGQRAEQVARLVLDLISGRIPLSFDPRKTCP